MRRRPRPGKTLRLCPQCGSARIVTVAGSIFGQVYLCEKCGYRGSLVFETEVDPNAVPTSDPDEE